MDGLFPVSRRHFLSLAAAGLAWFQRPIDDAPAPDMIVRSKRPLDLEMPPSGFADFITPVDRFFVRSHMTAPKVDLADWRLVVDGHVSTSLTLTMDDIRRMPSIEVVAVLECAGNGRSLYDPPVAGLQWTIGAVGNGRWRGVRLKDLLDRVGVKPGAVEILFDGVDVPIGAMADFQRSIPMRKALHPDTLLAYEMNGQVLTASHGFPLRVVVPGWAGNSWIKWVRNVRVLNEEFPGFWMKSAYLQPAGAVAPGAVVPADAMTPVTSLRVKSVIAVSGPGIVRGAAWTGDKSRVTGVDVSVDRGRTWRRARLTGPSTPYGWRLWEFPWTPAAPGYHTLMARARDSQGDVQPAVQEWNPSGYLYNAIAQVEVPAGPAIAASADAPSGTEAPRTFREACLTCHENDVVMQQRLTRAQWDRELTKMSNWGARIPPDERNALLDYLSKIAGPRR
jgi:sulfite oxidase